MLPRIKLGALALAAAATLVLAPTAMAKGGGGGGGGGGASCAQITSFATTPSAQPDHPGFTLDYTIANSCVDERMSSAAVDYVNETTGLKGRAVTMLSYGPNTFSTFVPFLPGGVSTITLTVYGPNGKIADTRSVRLSWPAT